MNLIKKITLSILTTLTLALFSLNASAQQAPKFAHIDYLKVVDSLPSMMNADREVQGFLESGEKTVVEMQKAFEDAYNQYLIEKPTLSTVMQELREKQLMEQQQMIEYKQQSLQQDLEILNERLYGPIEDNLVKAIEIVAERHKVTYMLEKSNMLYVAPTGGLDLTNEVRIELVRLEKERTGM